jgi:hypothetical protein
MSPPSSGARGRAAAVALLALCQSHPPLHVKVAVSCLDLIEQVCELKQISIGLLFGHLQH